MTPLAVLRACGFTARLDGDRLVVAPKDRLDVDARDYIRLYRDDIVAELDRIEPTPWEEDEVTRDA